jgi:HAD superfamily hydrolase (TIGR01509 family)
VTAPLLGVLVTSGGGWQGLGIIRSLRGSGRVRVVVADCHEDNIGRLFADAFTRVPPVAEGQAFLEAVAELCAREEVRLVLPATSFEQPLLAAQRAGWPGQGVAVAVSDAGFLETVGDKRRLYAALAAAGLPVLPTVDPRQPGPPYPLIAKPAGGWGSRDVVTVRGPADLARRPELAETHVFQPLLEGFTELSADFALDFDGRVSPPGIRRRVRTSGGFAVISQDAARPETEALVTALARWAAASGGRGLFNVQLLEKDGRHVFSDVNARLGTSAVHWRGTRHDPVLALCRSLEGELGAAPSPAAATARPRRTARYLEELDVPVEPLPGIEGLVFDLDDTLIHQKLWMAGKLEALVAGEAVPAGQATAFLREALRLVEEGPRATLFDELAARFSWVAARRDALIEGYRAAEPGRDVVFPDVRTTLDALRRRGFRLALLTDNPPASQRQKVARCGLEAWFEAVVFAREAGAEKPDLRPFAEAAARLGLPAARLATVGDNPHRDALPALEAGFAAAFVVRRPGTFHSFDPQLAQALCPTPERLRHLQGLQEILRHLGAAARP